MTFDEAVDKILFDSFEDTHNYDVVYTDDVVSLIKNLKEEYAPTIEMTREQYAFIDELFKESKALGATFEEFSIVYKHVATLKRVGLPLPFKTREEEMLAWLHPESIVLVGEKR